MRGRPPGQAPHASSTDVWAAHGRQLGDGDLAANAASCARHLRAANLTPATQRAYLDGLTLLARFLTAAGMPTDVAAITREHGHIIGSELVERCRQLDPLTTPSTVYRTLRVLEELGIVQHAHGADGREEFHVRPSIDCIPRW